VKVNEPKQKNIWVRKQRKWKLNKKGQQPRSFVWVREKNEVEQADQVNVVSINARMMLNFLNFLVKNLPNIKGLPR